MKIYLAGPVFSTTERTRNRVVARAMSALGNEVFLPQSLRTPEGLRPTAPTIFRECLAELDKCDLVAALVDGPDVDSGTAWEMGYAYANGKPIVSLRTDYRAAEHSSVNIMLEFSSRRLVQAVNPLGDDSEAVQALIDAVSEI